MSLEQLSQLSQMQQFVSGMYKTRDGSPFVLTPGQEELFREISCKSHSRLHVMCHTRYGKSRVIALAVLTRCSLYPEKWAIIAGTKEKAKIIMNYIISHIFDNDMVREAFYPDKGETKNDIRRHMNKSHLTFVIGKDETGHDLLSEISIYSAGDALGEGAENVVEDESCLISNNDHSLVVRMLGDDPTKNFMCKVGNPFLRDPEHNHFLKSYYNPNFKKIVHNCYTSLVDGRMTWDTIRENQEYTSFPVLYECLFPSQEDVDLSGWMHLFHDTMLQQAQQIKVQPVGMKKIAVDVQRGGRNFNAYVLRTANLATVLQKSRENDLELVADNLIMHMKQNNVEARNVFVDAGGVGGGVVDIMKYRGYLINSVLFGESASEDKKEKYDRARAEMYDSAALWLRQGGALTPHADWIELTTIQHRQTNSDKMTIKSKDDMRKEGQESPDVADAFAMTFARGKIVHMNNIASIVPGQSEALQQLKQNTTISPYRLITGGVKPYQGMGN